MVTKPCPPAASPARRRPAGMRTGKYAVDADRITAHGNSEGQGIIHSPVLIANDGIMKALKGKKCSAGMSLPQGFRAHTPRPRCSMSSRAFWYCFMHSAIPVPIILLRKNVPTAMGMRLIRPNLQSNTRRSTSTAAGVTNAPAKSGN